MAQKTLWQYCLLLVVFISLALAATPTSFCKCTCFTNSTLIPLNSKDGSSRSKTSSGGAGNSDDEFPDHDGLGLPDLKARSCADCTKSFCLSYNLQICKDTSGNQAPEQDVFTTCFQRDSTKDQIVIYVFIAATVSLLVWVAVRPWVGNVHERVGGAKRTLYTPVDIDSGR